MKLSKPEVIYEDNHLLVLFKPAGYLSQADGSGAPDILTWGKEYIKVKYNKPGDVYLGLLHRLDRPVSGIMVFARTSKAASRLSEQIRTNVWEKTYLAVLHRSDLLSEAKLNDYMIKDGKTNTSKVVAADYPKAKFVSLAYRILASTNELSLVEIKLETGRSHQIRVQFSSRNAPLFGDKRYGKQTDYGDIALCAYRLKLIHPVTKESLVFSIDYPQGLPWELFQGVQK